MTSFNFGFVCVSLGVGGWGYGTQKKIFVKLGQFDICMVHWV